MGVFKNNMKPWVIVLILVIVAGIWAAIYYRTDTASGMLTSIDNNWNQYTNKSLGISLKVPKTNIGLAGTRQPVQVLEKDNIIFVVSSGSYYFSKVKDALNSSATDINRTKGISWAILVRNNISSDTDLDKFIKDRYGKDCALGDKKASNQDGVYDIHIGGNTAPDKCFVNYVTEVKYDSLSHKLAVWDIGQAPNFFLPGDAPADEEMVKSFSFLR